MDFKKSIEIFLIVCTLFNSIYSKDRCVELTCREPNSNARLGELNWYCRIRGASDVIWFDNTGEQVINGLKYYSVIERQEVLFYIKDLSVSDNGIYRIVVTKGNCTEERNISVTVQDVPKIELVPFTFYKPGYRASVQMNITGYPFPTNIECKVFSCPDSTCEGTLLAAAGTQITNWKSSYTIELEPMPNASIVCTASNVITDKVNHARNVTKLIPSNSDLDKVDRVHQAINDNVELVCDVPFTYGPNLVWYNYLGEEINNSNTKYSIKTADTNISHQSFLTIMTIEPSESGVYTCKAQFLMGQNSFKNKLFNVSVHDFYGALIIESSLNNSLMQIFARDPVQLHCVVRGLPLPRLEWLKNSQPWTFDSADFDRTVIDKEIGYDVINSTLFIKHMQPDDSGRYTCHAFNVYGQDERFIEFDIKGVSRALPYIFIIIAIVFVFAIAITYLTLKVIKERKKRKLLEEAGLGDLFDAGDPTKYDPNNLIQDQPYILPYDKKWEFPKDKLKLLSRLGQGAFGEVWYGQARGISDAESTSDVAVKMLKKYASADEILALVSELKILMLLGKHLNVVNLLGACTNNRKQCELLVIEEYCEFGNLENYMKNHRDVFIDLLKDNRRNLGTVNKGYSNSAGNQSADYVENSLFPVTGDTLINSETTNHTLYIDASDLKKSSSPYESRSNSIYINGSEEKAGTGKQTKRPLNTRDLLYWAFQVTRGMDYLHSRHIIHRDLAARNILLAADNVVKICDFGLSKDIYKCGNYKKESGGKLPWRWMALESLAEMKFTAQSDVWSFGIVMWEMFSMALTPYAGFQADDYFYKRLRGGYRLDMPDYADEKLHAVMLDCWEEEPKKRPSFSELEKTLKTFLDDEVCAHYEDLNSAYITVHGFTPAIDDYLTMISSEEGYAKIGLSTDMSHTKSDGHVAISPTEDQVYYSNTQKLPTDGAMSNVEQNDSYFLTNENETHHGEVTPMLSK